MTHFPTSPAERLQGLTSPAERLQGPTSPAERLQPAPRAFSTVFAVLMVAAAAVHAERPGLIAAVLAMIAVLGGLRFRAAATLAVLFTVAAIVISAPPPLFAALSGLCAVAYLVLRHAVHAGVVTTTWPTVIGAIVFTALGVAATVVPLHVPWLPLLAPPAAVALYALTMRPFLGDGRPSARRSASVEQR
ncbi:MAG: conserved hypothetical transrane protein [Mycobacterium sp.]|jgi:hypothetical protein|nr:conserved hypothetical transrane protein [Mycobacterium sp.]